ncbi:MAG: penicillin-binding transpeptidase domain-containing protein [Alistipes shahii]
MITFYNAIANGGKMISPVLVRELRRGDRVEERFESRTIASSIASRAALREVQQCLQAVCTEGTASAFFRDTTRLRVAAKTGVSQITDARSREGRYYLGSMVAYFPADAPRYTVLTTIETRAQAGKAYYGGPLAGPVVKRMVDYIFNRGRDWYGGATTEVRVAIPTGWEETIRAGPPRGRPPVAPRLVRKPHGLGARRGGQPRTSSSRACPATGA